MPKAMPGVPYVVVSGDNLSKIAKQAYGDPRKWRMIWKANSNTLRSSDPNLIFPGEVLQLPPDPDAAKIANELGIPGADEFLSGKDPDEFTLKLGDKEIRVMSGRLLRTMDTVTDAFTAEIAWDPSDSKLKKLVKPYAYTDAKVYLGGTLMLTGRVYIVSPELSANGSSITIEGFSKTADIKDSTVKPPLEAKKITLKQRAEALLEPFGLTVLYEFDEGEPFDRVTAAPLDGVFSHLRNLARQRDVLISSTVKGELIFYQADIGKTVGTIEEGKAPFLGVKATFNGRERYFSYRVTGPTPKKSTGKNALEAVAKDETVPKSRFKTIKAMNATPGTIQSIADWERSKQVADALTIPLEVADWYGPDGKLFVVNKIVTVKAKSIFVDDGFDFLIKQVDYVIENGRLKATLGLVPPNVFTGKPLEEPWAESPSILGL